MKISIKFDASDSKQLADAASKLTGLLQGIKLDDIMEHVDKFAVVLGLLPDDTPDADKSAVPESGPVDENRISTQGFSAHTKDVLAHAGVMTVQELTEYSEVQLWRFAGMDESGILECRDVLEKHDLTLRDDEA